MKTILNSKSILFIVLLFSSLHAFSQTGSITVNPTSTGGCGQNATGTLTLNGYIKVVRWEGSDLLPNGNYFWDYLINETGKTISYNISSSMSFRAKINASLYSSIVFIDAGNVSPATVAGTLAPSSNSICGIGNGTITLSGHVGSVLRWEKNDGNGWANAGSAGSTTFNYTNLTTSTQYRAVVQSGSCTQLYSSTSQININIYPDGFIVGGNTYCSTTSNVSLEILQLSGTVSRWESSIDNGTTWTNIIRTAPTLLIPSVTQTTMYRALITSPSCGQNYTNTAILTIVPLPVAGSLNSSGGLSLCQNASTTISVSGNSGVPYYSVSSNGGASWNVIDQVALGSSFVQSFPTAGEWIIKTQPYNATCGIVPTSSQITINVKSLPGLPVIVEGNTKVMAGSISKYTVSPVANTTYSWSAANGTLLTGQNTTSITAKFNTGSAQVGVTATNLCGQSLPSIVDVQSGINFVRTETILISGKTQESDLPPLSVNEKNVSTTYIDGLGRPLQNVDWQASGDKNDIVQSFLYDQFGRENKKNLPYSGGSDGNFKIDAIPNQLSFYTYNTSGVASDPNPYSEIKFEASPLNRVQKQGAPGAAWQPDGVNNYGSQDKTVKLSYEHNVSYEVLRWTYTYPSAGELVGQVNAGTQTVRDYYEPNELYKTKTKDEQQHEVIEFKDKEGKIILKKVQASENEWAQTYYIYDDFGNLVVVLPPEAVKTLTK